jgi:surfactin synthase thioesterase subunit
MTCQPRQTFARFIVLEGRGGLVEPAMTSFPKLAEAITEAVARSPERPFAFFGHDAGAVLASEVARSVAARSLSLSGRLIVSGWRPLQVADPRAPIGGLADDAFVAEINRRHGGIASETSVDPGVVALLRPGLRADMIALETSRSGSRPPIRIPIFAFGGDSDPMTSVTHLEEWKSETQGAFALRVFPGGHVVIAERVRREVARRRRVRLREFATAERLVGVRRRPLQAGRDRAHGDGFSAFARSGRCIPAIADPQTFGCVQLARSVPMPNMGTCNGYR